MKINTEKYGVFYKDGENWRGPVNGELFDSDNTAYTLKELKQSYSKELKKKIKLFRQVWKSV